MKNGKSPGTDGFPAEFFNFLRGKLGPLVVRAINSGFEKGEMSQSHKEGVITCIPKGDKPREFLKNWRPITLLNTVYKIGSACIAARIKSVLPKLISEDQSGYVEGRYIGNNIRFIYDLIDYLKVSKLPGLLLSVDFEKAFDSLDWSFMNRVLEAFGFGNDICKWIRTFYTSLKSAVVVNGKVTSWFDVKRGCRQGDPISAYLFILCAEIMSTRIKNNQEIKGVKIGTTKHKILQLADDTQIFLERHKKSFELVIRTLETFEQVSGLKINFDKTKAV